MRKLDLILENIRDEYMINLLEEGEVSELETLKTKKFLNENLARIRGILVEEGAMDAVKQHLGDNWGKYLAGGAALAGANELADSPYGEGMAGIAGAEMDPAAKAAAMASYTGGSLQNVADNAISTGQDAAGELKQFGDKLVDQAGNIYDQAGQVIGNIADQAQSAMAPEAGVPGAPAQQ